MKPETSHGPAYSRPTSKLRGRVSSLESLTNPVVSQSVANLDVVLNRGPLRPRLETYWDGEL